MRNLPNPVSIGEESLDAFSTGQVSATTTAAPLMASGAAGSTARKSVKLESSGTVYVGDSNVTASNGYQLNAGDQLELKVYDLSTVYVVTASGSQTVSWVAV
ncbi:MAG TPA: hypothetical protein VG826_05305 [Pirellulales bacterium]|nr:hypothetical protein [Pirellulales bacterium]